MASEKAFRIMQPENRRLKRLLDIVYALLILFTGPLHWLLHKHPSRLMRNAWDVLLNRKTWIGYKTNAPHLPPLKASFISAAGIPHSSNTLGYENQLLTDEWYAHEYASLTDLQLLVKSYKKMGGIQYE